ncbi:MAG: beta-ketoacyl-[acyl-carrier-protein] synthase family protein [Bacteroidota bacterium]|jgi:3-oxoacyl-[acyl-carrier-protein] synthase-1|nr:beta-ketoacyl-[acyl-carrier-protein] synthase family protein [Bacteroidota bacterium]
MGKKVYVTGLGIISAIGNNVAETLDSFNSIRSGIGKLEHIASRHQTEIPVAEVKASNEELTAMAGFPKEYKNTRTALLGIIAAKEAVKDAGITDIRELRTGIISATSVGGMGMTENLWMDYLNTEKSGDWLRYIESHECGDSTEAIADSIGVKDYLSTISTACSSSANSIMLGARMIKLGLIDRVIAGGTDSLSKFTINGFSTLMILDKENCKPFDAQRKGLNLGEGAGFIVLESEEAAKGKKIYCELSGYGNSNDAYHQTASSPDGAGAYLAMEKAFSVSGLKPSDISYINAHGTGTEINDLSEGTALDRMFEKKVPMISSTKAFTGHTLGACGGIEAVFSALAIKNNMVFPSLNHVHQMPELSFTPEKELRKDQKIDHVLSNSFGFGGNTSALIFSKKN